MDIYFMFGAYRTQEWDHLFLLEYGVNLIPDTICPHAIFWNQKWTTVMSGDVITHIQCIDTTCNHISSPNARCILAQDTVLIWPVNICQVQTLGVFLCQDTFLIDMTYNHILRPNYFSHQDISVYHSWTISGFTIPGYSSVSP